MSEFDAIVIGGGHNGLTAARALAAAGRRVVVLEKGAAVGGMAAGSELAPGVRVPRLAHLLHGDMPGVPTVPDLPTIALGPDGRHVVFRQDSVRFADGEVHPDEASYLELRRRFLRFAQALRPLMQAPPPTLGKGGWGQVGEFGWLALRLRRLGKTDLREFLRIALSNLFDVIGDQIADGPLAGAMALDGLLGTSAGPRSPGSVIGLLYRYAQGGRHLLPSGGMGALCDGLAASAAGAGAQLRPKCAVEKVLVEDDRAVGVTLVSGEELRAKLTLCSLDLRATLALTGVEHFDVEMVRRARHLRGRGVAGKLNLVLSQRPTFAGLDDAMHGGRIVLAPSMRAIERAFDHVKYGRMSQEPVIELVIPTVADRSPAPNGAHVLSAVVQYVPFAPDGSELGVEAMATVLAQLERYCPGLRGTIVASEFLTPADIERLTGAAGGHWHHGEMALDQLLINRPVAGMGHYATGIGGLYLCGAGSHPGGDVTGAPGANAAAFALRGQPA